MRDKFHEIIKDYNPEKTIDIRTEIIKEKTMAKINTEKTPENKFFFKKSVGLIAAAVIGVTAGGAVLANELGAFDKAVNFFETRPNFHDKDIVLNEKDMNVVMNNLKEENIIAESNGSTLELTGSIYDEKTAYLFFTLTAPEGTVLNADKYEFRKCDFDLADNHGSMSACTEFADNDTTDNILTFTCGIYMAGDMSTSDLRSLYFNDFYKNYHKMGDFTEEDLLASGTWTIPLNLTNPSETKELIESPVKAGNGTITSVKVSDLNIDVTILNNYENNIVSVTMKDGTVYTEDNLGGLVGGLEGNGYNNFIYHFDKPLNSENITAITINGAEIPVN